MGVCEVATAFEPKVVQPLLGEEGEGEGRRKGGGEGTLGHASN